MEAVQFPYRIPMYYVSKEIFRSKRIEDDNYWIRKDYVKGQSKGLVDAHLMVIPESVANNHRIYYSHKEGIIYIEENNYAIQV
jgi:hypothetical protein